MTAAHDVLQTDSERDQDRRSYTVLGTVLMVIVLIIVILLFWRSCGKQDVAPDEGSGGGIITSVPSLETVPGGVAMWVKPGIDVDEVLGRNGLSGTSALDMGDGTHVISVGTADATATIEKLKKDPGLLDAGFLYAEDGTNK
ncbi:MAG: hypothetical protein U1E22_02690 [Coriobacteriia bacterium]|nr:hypothetical protein [Coriobacteriia bacterium]